MKTIVVSIFLGFIFLYVFPQNKLAGAGKAFKVGGTTVTQKKPSSTKSPYAKKSASSMTTPVKKDVDSKYESSAFMEITGVKYGKQGVINY